MRVPFNDLKNRRIYYMDENPWFRFAVYNSDKVVFIGLNKHAINTTMEECTLHDPEHFGYDGDVVPIAETETDVPESIVPTMTVNPTGQVWEPNEDLKDFLRDFEEDPDWPAEMEGIPL